MKQYKVQPKIIPMNKFIVKAKLIKIIFHLAHMKEGMAWSYPIQCTSRNKPVFIISFHYFQEFYKHLWNIYRNFQTLIVKKKHTLLHMQSYLVVECYMNKIWIRETCCHFYYSRVCQKGVVFDNILRCFTWNQPTWSYKWLYTWMQCQHF